MKKCPFCGADIEDSARFCLCCMQSLTEKEFLPPRQKKKMHPAAITCAIVAILLILACVLPGIQRAAGVGTPSGDTTPDTEPSSVQTEPSADTLPDTAPPSVQTEPSDTSADTDPPSVQTEPSDTSADTEPPSVQTEPSDTSADTEPPSVQTGPSDTSADTDPTHVHSFSEQSMAAVYLKEQASCMSPAVYYYSCVCGEAGSLTFSYGEPGEHTVVTVEGYGAGCVTPGMTEGKHCSVCLTVLVPQQSIPASGHDFDPEDPLAPCSVCGAFPTTHTHSYTVQNTAEEYLVKEADCMNSAVYCYSCACGEAGEETFESGGLGEHEIVESAGEPANCLFSGWTGGTYCRICYLTIVPSETIPPISHDYIVTSDTLPYCRMCGQQANVVISGPSRNTRIGNLIWIDMCTYTIEESPNGMDWIVCVSLHIDIYTPGTGILNQKVSLYYYWNEGTNSGRDSGYASIDLTRAESYCVFVTLQVPKGRNKYTIKLE